MSEHIAEQLTAYDFEQRSINQSAPANQLTNTFTPAVGEAWVIKGGWSSQSGATARTAFWTLVRKGTTYVLCDGTSVATNVRRQFYSDVIMLQALIVRYPETLICNVGALDAGAVLTAQLEVAVRAGETG